MHESRHIVESPSAEFIIDGLVILDSRSVTVIALHQARARFEYVIRVSPTCFGGRAHCSSAYVTSEIP